MTLFRPIFLALSSWLYTTIVSTKLILPRQGNPQNIWVTIDASGSSRTITPSVSASQTISGAPEHVTATSVYKMITASGIVQTSTGMAPVATATAISGAGAFVACSNYQGWDEPFCLPRRGSVLKPGVTYYVTWDPSYFALASMPVSIQVRYSDSTASTISRNISADTGYTAWTVDDDILTQYKRDGSDLVATLYLAYYVQVLDSGNNDLHYHSGPTIKISSSAPSYDASPESKLESHSKTVTIAVPVAIAVILLASGIFLLWSWRRHRSVCGIGLRHGSRRAKKMSSVSNYGWPEDKSHQVELMNREGWGSTQGKNIFREEIRRQETIRGY